MRVYCDVEANCGSIPIPVPSMTTVDREADRHLHGVAVQAKVKRDYSWGLRYERPAMAVGFPDCSNSNLLETQHYPF